MTLASTPPLIDYVEDGVSLVHQIPFQFEGPGEIVCTRIPAGDVEGPVLVQGADYSVTGGDGSAGFVTKTSGGTAGTVFRVRRVTQQTQSTKYSTTGGFPAENVEASLDLEMAVAQETAIGLQLLEQRTVRGGSGDGFPALPGATSRLLKFMQWAADGKSLMLLSASQLAAAIVVPLQALLPLVGKGDPGANVMAISLFAFASGLSIPVGTDRVRTSGHTAIGVGAGDYVADAAVNGAYVAANSKWSFISTNGRGFRLASDQPLYFAHFGATPGDVSANGAANDACMLAMLAFATVTGARHFRVSNTFWFASTIDINQGNLIVDFDAGGGTEDGNNPIPALFKFPTGVTGIRVQGPQTSGANTKDGAAHSSGLGTVIRNPVLEGAFKTTGVEKEAHGIQLRTVATIENPTIKNFEGDGIVIAADGAAASGASPPFGNADRAAIIRPSIYGCRNGIFFDGSDANACTVVMPDVNSCRQWGIFDSSGLGNTFLGGQLSVNGSTSWNNGTTGAASTVSSGGNRYAAIVGQEAWCSTHAPSGTTADNQGWYYLNAGAVAAGFPAWFNGMSVRAGGHVHDDSTAGSSYYAGIYAEGGYGKAQLTFPSVVNGGKLAEAVYQNAATATTQVPVTKAAGYGPASGGVAFQIEPAAQVLSGSVYACLGAPQGNLSNIALNLFHSTYAPAGYQLHFESALQGDMRFTYGVGAATVYWITGLNTAQQFGKGAVQPHTLAPVKTMVCGNAGDYTAARHMMIDAAPPGSGAHARGEIVFNSLAGVGLPKGWQCTVAGTPGTWVSMGNL